MSVGKSLPRRHFTEAARAAAIEARRRKRVNAVPLDVLRLFVVRPAQTHGVFGWEIRRFGGVVLHRSVVEYSTMAEARAAGEQALWPLQNLS